MEINPRASCEPQWQLVRDAADPAAGALSSGKQPRLQEPGDSEREGADEDDSDQEFG